MIIPGVVVFGVTGLVVYAIVVIGWFIVNTSKARSNYQRAVHWQRQYGRDDPDIPGELAKAEKSARRARLALVWPYAIGLHIAHHTRDALASNREIFQGQTELHAQQRELQIKRMEREIERLRREQEGLPRSLTVREGEPIPRTRREYLIFKRGGGR